MAKNSLISPIQFLGIAFTLGIFIFLVFFIDTAELGEWVLQAGSWAPIVFILLKMSTIVIAPISGTLLYPLVGLLFGFWEGWLYVGIGDFLGYSTAFFISRILGQKIVLRLISQNETGMLSKIVAHMSTTKGFLYICIVFFFSPELLSYGAGLSKLPYWKFILILWSGSMLATSLLVAFGSKFSVSGNDSLLLTLGLPLVGGCVALIGGWFFLRALKKE